MAVVGWALSEIQVNLSVFGLGGGTVTWARTAGDRQIARSVITFLEDRRLLFGRRHLEDEEHCIHSANDIRIFIGRRISESDPGDQLEGALRVIRWAARRFVDAGGPRGTNFSHRSSAAVTDRFSLALGELRAHVGAQLAVLTHVYELPVEYELAQIIPDIDDDESEQDLSWIPGFGT